MTNATQGIQLMTETFVNQTIFGMDWILALIIICLTCIIITRDIHKWQSIALPVTIMYDIVGLQISMIWYTITIILFILEAVSIQTIGHLINVAYEKAARVQDIKALETSRKSTRAGTIQAAVKTAAKLGQPLDMKILRSQLGSPTLLDRITGKGESKPLGVNRKSKSKTSQIPLSYTDRLKLKNKLQTTKESVTTQRKEIDRRAWSAMKADKRQQYLEYMRRKRLENIAEKRKINKPKLEETKEYTKAKKRSYRSSKGWFAGNRKAKEEEEKRKKKESE